MKAQDEVLKALGLEEGDRRAIPRWLWFVIAICAVLAAVAVITPNLRRSEPLAYVMAAVRQGPLVVTVTATGTLQPTNQVEVGSEVSGIIDDVFVDFNDTVEQGQILAELDTQTLEARLASARAARAVAEASLVQAEATVTEAKAKATRSRELAAGNIASKQSLETDQAAAQRAIAAVTSAKAQVTSASALLRESKTALAKAAIRAPIDGMVISREVDPGQTVAASFQTPVLFRIADDLRYMRLHLDIDESDIGLVREGQHASFRVDAYPGRSFEAELTSVRFSPREVNNVVTYETVLSVANPELLLRPGMTATADIMIEQKDDALLVPNRALRFLPPALLEVDRAEQSTQAPRVWVVRDGEATPLPVQTGLTNGEFTQITGGDIAPGTDVIVDIERAERPPTSRGPF